MERREIILLASIILLGIFARLLWWLDVADVIENEGAEYARLAENLFSREGYKGMYGGPHVFFPPMYPILIGILSYLFGEFETSARFVSFAAGTGLILLAWSAARSVFNNRAGLIAAFLVACHPSLIALSASTYSEGLFIFLSVAAVVLSLQSLRRDTWLWIALAGLVWAIAYLVRPEGLVFGAAFIVMTAVAIFITKKSLSKGFVFAAVGSLAFAVLAAPYIIDLSEKAGSFRWEGKSGVTTILGERIQQGMSYGEAARGLDEDGSAAGPMLRLEDQTWMLRHDTAGATGLASRLMADLIGKVWSTLANLFTARFLASPLIFAFAIAGFVATGWWREKFWPGAFFTTLGALSLVVAMSTDVQFSRYLFPILPVVAIWAAGGIDIFADRTAKFFTRSSLMPREVYFACVSAIICIGLSLFAFGPTYMLGEFSQARKSGVREIGATIRDDFQDRNSGTTQRPVIAGYGLAPAYYAGGVIRYLAYAPEEQGIQYLHRMSPHYVVLQRSEANQVAYVSEWLDSDIPHRCAHEISRVDASNSGEIRVWRWDCSSIDGEK